MSIDTTTEPTSKSALTCQFPGCDRELAYSGKGRPPKYCGERTAPDGPHLPSNPIHSAVSAWKERERTARGLAQTEQAKEEADRPVTASTQRVAHLGQSLTGQIDGLVAILNEIRDQIDVAGDPEAKLAEIETIKTRAEQEINAAKVAQIEAQERARAAQKTREKAEESAEESADATREAIDAMEQAQTAAETAQVRAEIIVNEANERMQVIAAQAAADLERARTETAEKVTEVEKAAEQARTDAKAKVAGLQKELERAQARAAADLERARTDAARRVEIAQEAQRQAERRADRAEADRESVTEVAERERITAAERLREHQEQMSDLRERATRAEAQREEERGDSRRYAAQVEQLRAQLAERDQPTA